MTFSCRFGTEIELQPVYFVRVIIVLRNPRTASTRIGEGGTREQGPGTEMAHIGVWTVVLRASRFIVRVEIERICTPLRHLRWGT
jgi:hypothetical protein